MSAAAAWTSTSSSSTSGPRDAADRLKGELQGGPAGPLLGKPGGVFVLAAGTVPDDGRMLIEAAARAVLRGDRGSLAEQLRHEPEPPAVPPELAATPRPSPAARPRADAPPEDLVFWNGLGGFTRDGREYVIVIDGTAPGGPRLPAGPVDQRPGQSRLRLPRDGGRARATPGPATAR